MSSAPDDRNSKTEPLEATADVPAYTPQQPGEFSFLSPATTPGALGQLGHYEVRAVLGQGGFGTVFRAFDAKLHREVALKVMAPQLAASSAARQRFLREARAAARIRSEHVVQIYAVEEQPLPHLVMELVPGEPLDKRLERSGPLPAGEIALLGRQIAEGLAAAHAQTLIHRDIKPANILVEDGPRVKITDFGLARAADDATLTQSGMIAGTPAFMSPEQARGETLDHRSDLFSLGSLLYALATGQQPFRASSTLAVLKRVVEETPRPLAEVNPAIPAWLSAIIARLMAKEPQDRYASAREVADALAWGAPVSPAQAATILLPTARPTPPGRKLLLAGGALLLLLALVVVALSFIPPTEPPPHSAATSAAAGTGKPTSSAIGKPTASAKQPEPDSGLAATLAARPSAADALQRAAIPLDVLRALEAPPELVAILGGEALPHRETPHGVSFNADGTLLATIGDQSPEVYIWDAATGRLRRKLSGPGTTRSLAFSPTDKEMLAVGYADNSARIWDVTQGVMVHSFLGHKDAVRCVRFSPKGERLVTTGNHKDKTVRIWDIAKAKELVVFRKHTGEVPYAEFSPDGTKVATAGCDGSARIFDAATGTELAVCKDRFGEGTLSRACFSSDGQRVASCCGQTAEVGIWNAITGVEEKHFDAPGHQAYGVAYSPDGKYLVSHGRLMRPDASGVQLYDADTYRPLATFPHPGDITAVAFDPSSKVLATCSDNKTVRLWDVSTGKEVTPQPGHDGAVTGVAFSPNGKLLASAGADDRTLRVWDMATGCCRHVLRGHRGKVTSVAFHPDNKTVASGSQDGTVRLWDAVAGTELASLPQTDKSSGELGELAVAFSADGTLLAAGGFDQQVKLWDTALRQPRHTLRADVPIWCLDFSPDGGTLAVGCEGNTIQLWNASDGHKLDTLRSEHGRAVRALAFAPLGRWLASGVVDGALGGVQLWQLPQKQLAHRMEGHKSAVLSCAWRGDGQLLANAGSADNAVRLWDMSVLPPRARAIPLGPGTVYRLALSPEGRHLATANGNGTIYILRLAKQGEVLRVP